MIRKREEEKCTPEGSTGEAGHDSTVFNARTQGAEKEGILNSMPVWAM